MTRWCAICHYLPAEEGDELCSLCRAYQEECREFQTVLDQVEQTQTLIPFRKLRPVERVPARSEYV